MYFIYSIRLFCVFYTLSDFYKKRKYVTKYIKIIDRQFQSFSPEYGEFRKPTKKKRNGKISK